jgi:hypothetical protein
VDWARKLADAAGWDGPAAEELDWDDVELRLGVELPADFKRLSEIFGAGEFDDWLRVYAAVVPEQLARRRAGWDAYPDLLDPYRLFADGVGLIPWGDSEQGDTFYWLADEDRPADTWPTVAYLDDLSWTRYEMTMSEFCCRLLAEEDFDFDIAGRFGPPVFYPVPGLAYE